MSLCVKMYVLMYTYVYMYACKCKLKTILTKYFSSKKIDYNKILFYIFRSFLHKKCIICFNLINFTDCTVK